MPALHNLDDETVYAILVVNNPMRWKSRVALYKKAEAHYKARGFHVITVEHQTGTRPFEVTSDRNPDHVQLRGSHDQVIWLKEALANAGVRLNLTRRFPNWKYVVFADADIELLRPDIVDEIRHELQLSLVGQAWSHSIDLGPQHEIVGDENGRSVDRSFSAAFVAGEAHDPNTAKDYKDPRQHVGYIWFFHRVAYEGIGGLMDWVVTGAADWYMAYAFAGIRLVGDDDLMPSYKRRLNEFFERVQPVIKRRLGVVHGTIAHGWHGAKAKRAYVSRREILKVSKFDPDKDLAYDSQGIPFVCSDNFSLLFGLRRYFESRAEDSVDV